MHSVVQEQGSPPNRPFAANRPFASSLTRNLSTAYRASPPSVPSPVSPLAPAYRPSFQRPAASATTVPSNTSAPKSVARPSAASSPLFAFKAPPLATAAKPVTKPASQPESTSAGASEEGSPRTQRAKSPLRGFDVSLASKAAQRRGQQPDVTKPAAAKPSASQWLPRGATRPTPYAAGKGNSAGAGAGSQAAAKPAVTRPSVGPSANTGAIAGARTVTGTGTVTGAPPSKPAAGSSGVAPKANAAQWLPRGIKLSTGPAASSPPPPSSLPEKK